MLPVTASCMAPTNVSPDRSITIPVATSAVGFSPAKRYAATATSVAIAAPVTCWKKNGVPIRLSSRPVWSITADVTAASTHVSHVPPSSIAMPSANPAQPTVASQRG